MGIKEFLNRYTAVAVYLFFYAPIALPFLSVFYLHKINAGSAIDCIAGHCILHKNLLVPFDISPKSHEKGRFLLIFNCLFACVHAMINWKLEFERKGVFLMIRSISIGFNTMDVYDFIKTMYPGGNQLNTAIYAKWAGADAAYLGYFSDDVRGRHLKWVLEKNGVDLTRCKMLHGQCSYAMTTLVDGNRTFHGTRKGVNAMTPIRLDKEDLAYIKGFDLAISDCYSNLDVTEIQKINDLGIPFAYDFSEEFTEDTLKEYCPHVDYCFLSCNQQGSEEQIQALLRRIHSYGPKIVVGTRGAEGQIVFDGEQFYVGKAAPATVVDTMGAGDSFTCSFSVAYTDSKKTGSERIRETMDFAAKFAAKICGINGSVGDGLTYEGNLEDLYSDEDGYAYKPYVKPFGEVQSK